MNKPTLGPIIGQNSPEMLRVMVRGDEENKCGIMVVSTSKTFKGKLQQHIIPFSERYDYCNVFLFEGLDSGTTYYFKVAMYSEEENIDESLAEVEEIHSVKIAKGTGSTNFLLGSCRYIMETAGIWMFGHQSDKTYRTALQEGGVRSGDVDFMLHVGDQIYADDLNILSADVDLDLFYKKYRYAFGTPYFREMAGSIANYMTMDDHEIEDNWPDQRSACDKKKYFNAMHAYQIYQASHSPAVPIQHIIDLPLKLKDNPKHWYYDFYSGSADFFVMDVRTERVVEGQTKMISEAQMKRLKEWLLSHKERTKCIVSSVPFLMERKSNDVDKWSDPRFIHQRNEILEFIYKYSLDKVVFLSGDIHASYTCYATKKDTLLGTKPIKVHQIISSPIYYPYHFLEADAEEFVQNGTLANSDGWVMQNENGMIFENGVAKIELQEDGFDFTFFGRKGEKIKTIRQEFTKRTEQDEAKNKKLIKQEKKKLSWFVKLFRFIKRLFDFKKTLEMLK